MRLLFLLLVLCTPLAAELIQVGEGTVINQSLPVESARSYSYSQQVYLASQIGSSGNISSIAFQYYISGNSYLATNHAWKVWLGHTAQNSLADWIPLDSLSLCYDGNLSLDCFSGGLPGEGWMTISLNTPFTYDGTGNLLIAVDENTPGSSSMADEYLCTGTSVVRGIVFADMTVNPDPAAPPAISSTGFFARSAFPNLRLDLSYYSLLPYLPLPADQATGVSTTTGLQWQSQAASFDLYFGTAPGTMDLLGASLSQTEWDFSAPLLPQQQYFWKVVAHDGGQDYPGPVWSFSTIGEEIGAPQNLVAYFNTDHVQLSWSPPPTGSPSHYWIFRNGTHLSTCETTSWQDSGVSGGQDYYYYVKAENTLGELSAPSNTVTVHVPDYIPDLILLQSFEGCAPFSQVIANWQNLDLDGSPTWQWASTDFPHEGEALAWLSFVPSQTVPPATHVQTHSGSAMLVSMSSTTPPSNDWLISGLIHPGTSPELTFWARSHTAEYGLERLRVLVSSTNTLPASFTALSPGNFLSVPAAWTEYSYDLSPWQGQSIYLAWQCLSWDAFALYLDDIVVTGAGGYVPLADELLPGSELRLYPNPNRGAFALANPAKAAFDLSICDLRGRLLFERQGLKDFNSLDYGLSLPSGVYLCKLTQNGKQALRRFAVLK